MNTTRKALFLISLFLTNVGVMADMVIVPGVAGLYATFSDVHLVNFVVSGPALITVFSALATGALLDKTSIPKKYYLVAGFALFAVASIFGAAIPELHYVLGMRVLVGIAMGVINVTAISIITDVYQDDTQRGNMIGYFNAAMAGIGAIIGFAAGFFAVNGWQEVFKVYWISLPILLMLVLFLPRDHAHHVENQLNNEELSEPIKPGYIPHLIGLCASMVAINAIYAIVFFQIAVYVAETGIGNEALAGTLSALGTVGSFAANMIFGRTYALLNRASIVPSYLLIALTYIALLVAPSVPIAVIACTLMGAAFGNSFSYFFLRATIISPPQKVDLSIGLITACGGIGMFVSTYIATFVQSLLGVTGVIGIIPVLATVSVIATILSIMLTLNNKKHPAEYELLETSD